MASVQITTKNSKPGRTEHMPSSYRIKSAESIAIARRKPSLFVGSDWSYLELFLHVLAIFLMAGIVILSIRLAWILSLS